MTQEFSDFYRLAAGLRAMKIDFDYAETRKLLEPDWNGYDIPKGHDIIAADVPLSEANGLTSRHRDSELHRVVLDLDNGASAKPLRDGGHELSLHTSRKLLFPVRGLDALNGELSVRKILWSDKSAVVLKTNNDLALIPSSTSGHHHLILDVNLPWRDYTNLLYMLESYSIIEYGYRKASVDKGYTTIRVPWVKKQGKTSERHDQRISS